MNPYKPLDAEIMGAQPLPLFAAPPPVAFGPIFHPPSRPALAATSGGAGAGLAALAADPAKIRCNG